MKIGIFGPLPSIERIRALNCMDEMYFECVEYPCDLNEVPGILGEVQKDLDGVLFTGDRYFRYASQYVSAIIPWGSISRSRTTLYVMLLQACLTGKNIKKITYDLELAEEELVSVLCDKIGFSREELAVYRYNDTRQFRNYIERKEMAGKYAQDACKYHMDNLQTGRAEVCLTDSSTVAWYMEQQGQPVFLFAIMREDVISALNNIRFRNQIHEQLTENKHEEAVVRVTVRLAQSSDGGYQGYRQLRCNYQVESSLHSFAQKISATIEKQADLDYLLYSTKEELDMSTLHFSNLYFLEGLLSIVGVEEVFAGIGFGSTHSKAKSNAQEAIQSATRNQKNCYFVKEENEVLKGPFLIKSNYRTKDTKSSVLEHVSLHSGVGITVLKKLEQAQRQYGFQTVTSAELAEMTGMSLNNIHKILSRLEETGYVEVVGKRPGEGHGRPRRLLMLNF